MPLTLSKSSPPKQSFFSRIFSGPSSSSSMPRKSGSSNKKSKSGKSSFIRSFRRAPAPPPSTMDKLQARLDPSPDATPASVAAMKRKAKKDKAKKDKTRKEANRTKNSSSFFRRN
ncbi:hypothetical protein BGZ46_004236 [Entomortierella lignicola]|nr:hypothetical protein BGZ46_004236 [Entomortierella lignicola]